MKNNRLLPVIMSFFLLACSEKEDVTPDYQTIITPTGEWQLVWNEEFDYEGLPDAKKWSYETRGNAWGWGNDEAQFYTADDPDNAYVKNGVLTITAKKEKIKNKRYTSARLITKRKGDWLYGRFEIRAKLPRGKGTWPAIWMHATDSKYGKWPASGEIDIMENVGYDPENIVGSVHTKSYNHVRKTHKSAKLSVPDNSTAFHVYALEWEEKECRIYVDDKHFFTFTNEKKGFSKWPFDKKFYLILNLAVGGTWGGRHGIDDSLFPHHFYIDYVRVYRKKE